ncbi:uncharacterized protein [Primulina eburnea]|uniref:uncharacterized protein n=1 Tax=Primulina eburnea TaxID=1245227 RepID=UPI003C6BF754
MNLRRIYDALPNKFHDLTLRCRSHGYAGRLEFTGNNIVLSLWPADGKPGLWMNSTSRMAAIYTLVLWEEEIIKQKSVVIMDRRRLHLETRNWNFGGVAVGISGEEPFCSRSLYSLGTSLFGDEGVKAAEAAAERVLQLIMDWESPWDKRMSWQGWIALGRVVLMKAKEKAWPDNPWRILN